MRDYGWPKYVPVATQRAKALKQLEKMRKKGLLVAPVQLAGRAIATSFWGKGWCDHMESFSDYDNRLPRGRTYVRNGSVCHLAIKEGRIEAMVCGSSLYQVSITIKPLITTKWQAIKRSCSGRIGSLIDLLRGKLDRGVMEVVTSQKEGLFPLPGEMEFNCTCPDWAVMCKHVAATLYGVGARLDASPEMLFTLRGVRHEELIDISVAMADTVKVGTSRRRIATPALAEVFGVELADAAGEPPAAASAPSELSAQRPAPEKDDQHNQPVPPARAKSTTSRAPRSRSVAAEKKEGPVQPTRTAKAVVKKAVTKKTGTKPPPFPEPLTGEAIRAWRLALGETQAAFAARFDVTASCISQWEKKKANGVGMFSETLALLRKAWKGRRRW